MPHKHTFEDKLKNKLHQAGLTPPDLWPRIEAELDKPARKPIARWQTSSTLLLIGVALLAGARVLVWIGAEPKVHPQKREVSLLEPSSKTSAIKTAKSIVSPNQALEMKAKGAASAHMGQPQGAATTQNTPSEASATPVPATIGAATGVNPNELAGQVILHTFPVKALQEVKYHEPMRPFLQPFSPPGHPANASRFSIGGQVWVSWAHRWLFANNNATATEQDYVKFRNLLDRPFQAVSGGLAFSVKLTQKIELHTGLYRVNYTEQMGYATKSTFPTSVATPLEVNPSYALKNPNWQKAVGDSIIAGRQDSGRLNRYAFTDLPLLIGYRMAVGKKWKITPAAGITLSQVRAIRIYMPDLNHFGFISITSPSNFKGVSSYTVNSQVSLSASYPLRPKLWLTLNSNARMALNPLITYAFARQYPVSWGLGAGICREF